MSVPLPPSDNLYKFAAVSGCILLAAGTVGSLYGFRELTERDDRLSERFVAMSTEAIKQGVSLDVPNTVYRQGLDGNVRSFKMVICFCVITGAIGIGMMGVGFSAWYNRVQRYQDALLKLEVMKGEASFGVTANVPAAPAITVTTGQT